MEYSAVVSFISGEEFSALIDSTLFDATEILALLDNGL
jgi:hypothetical protein